MSDLIHWLEENEYFTSKNDTKSSHLLYNGYKGGVLYIPRDKDYAFLCKYAEELKKKSLLLYVEVRPQTFKFMVDIDMSDDHYWSKEEIIDVTKIIQKTVYDFYEANNPVICLNSAPKTKKEVIHTGVHLIWPTLVFTSDTALIIRRGIIQKLNEYKTLEKSWESIVDEVIYTRNGYRMVGSDKLNNKKEPENRPLELLFVMNSDGEISEGYYARLKRDPKALATETSIRYVIDTYLEKGMTIKYPTWLDPDALEEAYKKSGISSKGSVVSQNEHVIIENFIRKNLPSVYYRCVKSISRYPKEDDYPPALLIKTNSKYCMNISRNHNSCGIYFYATPAGITQKCLCNCDKTGGRKFGLCREYTSSIYPFDPSTKELLFPEECHFEEPEKKPEKKGSVKKESIKKGSEKDSKEKDSKPKKKPPVKKDVYVPPTEKNMNIQQKKLSEKMFKDIMKM
jgi:hypothetical protein